MTEDKSNATTDPEATVDGQSFYNPALTGSGTITQDGTYAAPLPDPTQIRGLGPNRTSGGRLVPGADADTAKVNEVIRSVVGEPPSVQELRGPRGSDSDENRGAAKDGTGRRAATK